MTIKQLARIFLRFHGLLFLGTVIYECISMARDYQTFVTDALSPETQAYGAEIFWLGIFRTVVYALAGFVLLVKTDLVISLLGGREEPIQSPQRNAGSRPPSDDSSASETPSSLGPRG